MTDPSSESDKPVQQDSEPLETEHKMPRIEFPCAYPIKIMGVATEVFTAEVVSVCKRHAPEVCDEHVTVRLSNKGNYAAITVLIEATGTEQLQNLFADLKATDSVKMVL
jgi:putative lipoic acid-binding regulatory protein